MNNLEIFPPSKAPGIDLDDLLRPDLAFDSPMDVVNDPDLTLHEKRSMLAAWASDARAAESAPALRNGPAGRLVSIDEILEALRILDRKSFGCPTPWARRHLRRSSIEKLREGR
jgi:hypothetical protein